MNTLRFILPYLRLYLLLIVVSTAGYSVTVSAINRGWYQSVGGAIAGFPVNPSYLVGEFSGNEFRNYFVFDLSGVAPGVTGATFRIFNPSYVSVNSTEVFSLFDFGSSITSLQDGTADLAEFNDLGTGKKYGNASFDLASNGTWTNISLNSDALADINGSLGGLFAIGGAITSLGATDSPEVIFNDTHISSVWGTDLALSFAAVPSSSAFGFLEVQAIFLLFLGRRLIKRG